MRTRSYYLILALLGLVLICSRPATAQLLDDSTSTRRGDFAFLARLQRTVSLNDLLDVRQSYTIFAPTNAAFDQLPPGMLDELLDPDNRPRLRTLLTAHVVAGRYDAATLREGQRLLTVQGQPLRVHRQGTRVVLQDVQGNEALIDPAGKQSRRGIIYLVDKVLLPAG